MEDNLFMPDEWLKRAKSNLYIAISFDIKNLPEEIYLEDLCFNLQQCAEKCLKAVLIKYQYNFSKTHDIAFLMKLVKENTTIKIPENIEEAKKLNVYAVKTRYPNWNKLSVENYNEAVKIAKETLSWAQTVVKE